MPALHQVIDYVIIVMVVVLIPGPSVLFVVTRAVTYGRRIALQSVIGNALGLCVQVAVVAIGLGAFIAASTVVPRILGLVGGCLLVYLGVMAVRHRRVRSEAIVRGDRPPSPRRRFGEAVIVGATNPKSLAFLVASLPVFVDHHRGDLSTQLLVLGACFPLVAVICDSAWALLGGAGATWLARDPRRLSLLGGIGGCAMVCVGAIVAVQALVS